MNYKKLKPSSFEHTCNISNGYLHKQFKGKGTIGSDIVEKIHRAFPELNMSWVITGKAGMIIKTDNDPMTGMQTAEGSTQISAREEVVILLRKQVAVLEAAVKDKNRIIALLEEQLALKKNTAL